MSLKEYGELKIHAYEFMQDSNLYNKNYIINKDSINFLIDRNYNTFADFKKSYIINNLFKNISINS